MKSCISEASTDWPIGDGGAALSLRNRSDWNAFKEMHERSLELMGLLLTSHDDPVCKQASKQIRIIIMTNRIESLLIDKCIEFCVVNVDKIFKSHNEFKILQNLSGSWSFLEAKILTWNLILEGKKHQTILQTCKLRKTNLLQAS